jgi:hypothetical protein
VLGFYCGWQQRQFSKPGHGVELCDDCRKAAKYIEESARISRRLRALAALAERAAVIWNRTEQYRKGLATGTDGLVPCVMDWLRDYDRAIAGEEENRGT